MEAIRYCSAADASAGAVGVALAWDSTIADAADGLRVELIEATPPKLAQTLADTRRVASKKKMVSRKLEDQGGHVHTLLVLNAAIASLAAFHRTEEYCILAVAARVRESAA
ncbi:hypothetical protein MMC22_010516 [Lobaria immixta]|nr:hypothetical protein [Lobaria immixta]